MARVEVKLFAILRQYIDGAASTDVEIEPGETVGDVLDRLGVPHDQTRVMFLNSRAVDLTHVLQGGEELSVFPAIGGG